MDAPFIYIGTYTVREGKLEAFKQHIQEFCRYVEEQEPRLIHFGFYLDESGSEVSIVQVHPDPASMEWHLEVIREHLTRSYEFLEGARGDQQIYGTPGNALLERLMQAAAPGAPVLLKSPTAGFSRLPSPVAA